MSVWKWIFDSQDYQRKEFDSMFEEKFGHKPLFRYKQKASFQYLIDDSLGFYLDEKRKVIYKFNWEKYEWEKHDSKSSMYEKLLSEYNRSMEKLDDFCKNGV